MCAKDLAWAEFVPVSISERYETNDEMSKFSGTFRYLLEGASAGLLLGSGFSEPDGFDPVRVSVGGYILSDIALQLGYEFGKYLKNENAQLGAYVKPATIAVEASYSISKKLTELFRKETGNG